VISVVEHWNKTWEGMVGAKAGLRETEDRNIGSPLGAAFEQ